MPEFQEVRVRMEDQDVGPFIRFLSEQKIFKVFVVGVDPIRQVLRLIPPDSAEVEQSKTQRKASKYTYSQRKSMRIWKRVYDIIKEGYQSFEDIKLFAGYKKVPHTAKRVINSLKAKGYVKGEDGTYTVVKELD